MNYFSEMVRQCFCSVPYTFLVSDLDFALLNSRPPHYTHLKLTNKTAFFLFFTQAEALRKRTCALALPLFFQITQVSDFISYMLKLNPKLE